MIAAIYADRKGQPSLKRSRETRRRACALGGLLPARSRIETVATGRFGHLCVGVILCVNSRVVVACGLAFFDLLHEILELRFNK